VIVGEGEPSIARRTIVSDPRGDDRYLRVAWHPEQSVVVLSHWHNEVCVATSTVGLADLPRLIGLLADAVGDADQSYSAGISPPLSGRKADRRPHVVVGGE
jgi:hypothetical protein